MTIYGGRLGTPQILDDTLLTQVWIVPDGFYSMAAVNLVNRSDTLAPVIRMAISDSETPSLEEYIEWELTLPPRGILERTQLFLQAGRRLFVSSSIADVVSVSIYGFLQDTLVESVEQP